MRANGVGRACAEGGGVSTVPIDYQRDIDLGYTRATGDCDHGTGAARPPPQTCWTCCELYWFRVNSGHPEVGCYLIPLGRFGDPTPAEEARYELASAWLTEQVRSVANILSDAPPCPAWRPAPAMPPVPSRKEI